MTTAAPAPLLAALLACRRGVTTLVLAIALPSLLLTSLLAIDIARLQLAQGRLQQATDAAALSAGQDFYSSTLATDIRQVFDANFPSGYLGTAVESFNYTITASGTDSELLTLEVGVRLPSPAAMLAELAGLETYHPVASATVERRTKGMELVLVLDVTGSMVSDNKIGALKTAAKGLLDSLYGGRSSVPNLWVGVVPYIAAVNVGTANIGFLQATDRARSPATAFSPDKWGGCVLARAAPRDQNDDPPSVEAFKSYLYPDITSSLGSSWSNDWGVGRTPPVKRWIEYSAGVAYVASYGPNTGCPPTILPLSVEKAKAVAAIDALIPEYRGGTITSEGMAWGWRVLSPRWRGLWSGAPSTLPHDYGTNDVDKVMVVLTDGDNQMLVVNSTSPYTAYESHKTLGVTSTEAAEKVLNTRTSNVCTNIKSKNITLYTITFGPSPSTDAQNLMRGCASSVSHYFHSPDNATLSTVFRTIGSQLSAVRLAR